MKKFLTIIILICVCFSLSGCFFEEISLLYSDLEYNDGFLIAVNESAKCCFVGHYDCTEYVESAEITIPDEYNGMPIKRIGGYYGRGVPTPFAISLSSDDYMNAPEGSKYDAVFSNIESFDISEDYTVKEIVFTLNIGKNIDTVEFVDGDSYFPHINDDESITFYHPVVWINCSEENKFFYSKDGKLYNKSTNSLISDFAYSESLSDSEIDAVI